VLFGCATSVPHRPPGVPPTPATVTLENPGGDAADPQEAALRRQLEMPWGSAEDQNRQIAIPMPDPWKYRRVKFWAFDHFVGFRYGDDSHVVNAAMVLDVPKGSPTDTKTCRSVAEKWALPQLKNFDVKLEGPETTEFDWRGQPVLVTSLDGYVDFGFDRWRFSAAYAAYPAYPDACLVFGMAVPWRKHADLAREVRDRWVKEGAVRLRTRTTARPIPD
jgi:hypothetical protein